MGLLGKILGKLGIGDKDSSATTGKSNAFSGVQSDTSSASQPSKHTSATMNEVDVVGLLEQKASLSQQKLNWRTSIVDLLKLLDIDSSLTARKELANELGAPDNLKDGSAGMNVWLHKQVLTKVAANGGNVPRELLD